MNAGAHSVDEGTRQRVWGYWSLILEEKFGELELRCPGCDSANKCQETLKLRGNLRRSSLRHIDKEVVISGCEQLLCYIAIFPYFHIYCLAFTLSFCDF